MKTIALSGLTGQGVETAGEILASLMTTAGFTFRTWRDFSTVIRGGSTSYEITWIEDEDGRVGVGNPARGGRVQSAVVFDQGGVKQYRSRMQDERYLFGSQRALDLPKTQRDEVPRLGYNIWGLGVLAGYVGIPKEDLLRAVCERFPDPANRRLAQLGYEKIRRHTVGPERAHDLVRLSGNQALALGALAGGVRFYCGYPITPASDILEILAQKMPEVGGIAYQVEDEIAAIHMAIGASYAGQRTFVATSGPGISLMTEGLGYAATIEVPLVVVDNQRGGPSTGMPTKTEQSDLNHVLYGGHGEFGRVVLAPSETLDSVQVMQEALNLADRYQCVVLVVLDLDTAMNQKAYPWSRVESLLSLPVERGDTQFDGQVEEYRRYAPGRHGSMPLRTVPGVVGGQYVASGDEHEEHGWMEPDFGSVRGSLHHRRLHKVDTIDYGRPWDRVGNPGAATVLVGMGAVAELIEAAISHDPDRYQGLLMRQLAPLPELPAYGDEVREVIVVEYNATGQLATRLARAWPGCPRRYIRRFDGEHFTREDFLEALVRFSDAEEGVVD